MDATRTPQRENPWLNIGFNLILPILLLTKGKSLLGDLPAWLILVIALAFPVGYFIYDWRKRGKQNVFSILGMISVLLTGGIGLLQLPPEMFLLKETLLPLIIGAGIAASAYTSKPALKFIFYNEDIVDVARIDDRLDTEAKRNAFQAVLKKSTLIFAASSILTAIVNFITTKIIVTADPRIDADRFNEQIGTQTGVTFVVLMIVSLPFMFYALNVVFSGIKNLTGLEVEQVFHGTKASETTTET